MQRGTQPRQFEKLFEGKKKSHGYLKGMLWDDIDADGKCTKDARTRHRPPNFNKMTRPTSQNGARNPIGFNRKASGLTIDTSTY